ncbi:MAG: hypothetical protein FGM52_03485 [Mycobacterium sp.]|nr:hypothetical protein [Mycobacterium sp.]
MNVKKVTVENVNVPGHTSRVDAEKYSAMKDAILAVAPTQAPGLTAKEMLDSVLPLLPQNLWPDGVKAGWWQKTVQLDLEAKGLLRRCPDSAPLRWFRV